jgi:hypothetical protein
MSSKEPRGAEYTAGAEQQYTQSAPTPKEPRGVEYTGGVEQQYRGSMFNVPEGYQVAKVEVVTPQSPIRPGIRGQTIDTTPQPILKATLEPIEKPPQLGYAELAYYGLILGESLFLARFGLQNNPTAKTLLELGPMFEAYAAVGAANTFESDIYGLINLGSSAIKSVQTGQLQYSPVIVRVVGPTTIGSVLYPSEGEAMQKRPVGYQLGAALGEGAEMVLTGYATGRVTSYVFTRSGLAARTESWLNQSYIKGVEESGAWQPTRIERLVMRVTGLRPNVGTSIVDIPEQMLPETPSTAIKEYPTFAEKYYINTGEPMPKDWMQGFSFEGSSEEVKALGKVSPLKDVMPSDFLSSFEYREGLKAGVPSEPMPSGFLSSYGLPTSEMTEITKITPKVSIPSMATVTRQELAWSLTESPRSSGLLMGGKFVEPTGATVIARGSWSSLGLGASGAEQAVSQVTKFTVPETPKAIMETPLKTEIPTRPIFATQTYVETTRQLERNPFLYSGVPYYAQRGRAAEQEEIYPVLPGQLLNLQRLMLNLENISLNQFTQPIPDVAQMPTQIPSLAATPIQGQPQITVPEIPELTTTPTIPKIPEPTTPFPTLRYPPLGTSDFDLKGFGIFNPPKLFRMQKKIWEFPVKGPEAVMQELGIGRKQRRRKR